jgi:UDP-N-acetylglucosamine--N-acetylmuramyl-(pentapeptide) pyrophosphoryl-undecaprenol N-acetylglucosamine transferase
MCREAERYTGLPVRCLTFSELDYEEEFDGVWACASLLHVPSAELPDVLACTDLVLSRAGANALCEFQALGRPMLLIPYPKGASRGDQILNAKSLEKRGLCRVLLQENMNQESLTAAVRQTWADREVLVKALKDAPPADGTARVLEMIEEIRRK